VLNNTTGTYNTATGFGALSLNLVGSYNTANGPYCLYNNTASLNQAFGFQAMFKNTTGSPNSAFGFRTLFSNTTGKSNVAIGVNALHGNISGSTNIAIGNNAGTNVTIGNNNIEIGNGGTSSDNNTIFIGVQGTQTQTFIAGIAGSAVTGSDVVVNGSGKLGVVVSSARYKRDISDMGSSTDALMKLHPVTFTYKSDPEAIKQYGLVAEEVDKVYPELVVHDDAGKVQSVRYSMLTSMLLNELQKQARKNEQQAEQIEQLAAQVAAQRAAFEQRLAAIERTTSAQATGVRLQAAFNR